MKTVIALIFTFALILFQLNVAQAQNEPLSQPTLPAPATVAPKQLPAPHPVMPIKPAAVVAENNQLAVAPTPAYLPRLKVGTNGYFQPGILLQGWFLLDRQESTTSTFRLRRAEMSVKGEIIPKWISYALMIDAAKVLESQEEEIAVSNQTPAATGPETTETVQVKQPPKAIAVLQDFFITFQLPYVDLSLGQFKIPVSWEGYNTSSSKLLFPERAIIAREFGDVRDLGLRLTKRFRYFGYSAGVFNGATLNNLDTNNAKDGALRLELYPIPGMALAGVVYASIGQRGEVNTKDRYEGDLRFERGPFLFQSEYIRAHDVKEKSTDAQGFYATLAYNWREKLQPAFRVTYFDPDIHQNLMPQNLTDQDELWQYDVGINYYIRQNEAKLQVGYSRMQYENKKANNEIILVAQVAF